MRTLRERATRLAWRLSDAVETLRVVPLGELRHCRRLARLMRAEYSPAFSTAYVYRLRAARRAACPEIERRVRDL